MIESRSGVSIWSMAVDEFSTGPQKAEYIWIRCGAVLATQSDYLKRCNARLEYVHERNATRRENKYALITCIRCGELLSLRNLKDW